VLFGLIFLVPLLGAAIGAAAGALVGRFTDYGIDDDFVRRTREQIVQGTSALFVLTSNAVTDRVAEAFSGVSAELLFTKLSGEREKQLREVFADD
jgi:uncharacterized membrane protein